MEGECSLRVDFQSLSKTLNILDDELYTYLIGFPYPGDSYTILEKG
jgi:hypothetical protein